MKSKTIDSTEWQALGASPGWNPYGGVNCMADSGLSYNRWPIATIL